MRSLSFLLLFSLFAIACTDDPPLFDNKLQLDGNNDRAPVLNAGDYETAVYFSASVMEDKANRELRDIDFFLFNDPGNIEVVVYGDGSVRRPGAELYKASLSNLRENRWNTHVLPEPITLDGNPIWISVKFTTDVAQQVTGCDAGPGQNGGDFFFSSIEGGWVTYGEVTGESINWNVRGGLTPE